MKRTQITWWMLFLYCNRNLMYKNIILYLDMNSWLNLLSTNYKLFLIPLTIIKQVYDDGNKYYKQYNIEIALQMIIRSLLEIKSVHAMKYYMCIYEHLFGANHFHNDFVLLMFAFLPQLQVEINEFFYYVIYTLKFNANSNKDITNNNTYTAIFHYIKNNVNDNNKEIILNQIKNLIDIFDKNIRLYLILGYYYEQYLYDYEEAFKCFKYALKLNPYHSNAHFCLAELLATPNNYETINNDQILFHYQKAIQYYPHDNLDEPPLSQYYLLLAMFYEVLKDYKQSKLNCEYAINYCNDINLKNIILSQYKYINKRVLGKYCMICGHYRLNKIYKCKQCKQVFYCSKSCQKKDWNKYHRNICISL